MLQTGTASCCLGSLPHLTSALPFHSSTSTQWPPPSSRRCFRQTPLPAPPFTSCSMMSSSLQATSPPVSLLPASPSHQGFQLLPAAWTPAAGSLSQSSIKVKIGLGRREPRFPGYISGCMCLTVATSIVRSYLSLVPGPFALWPWQEN